MAKLINLFHWYALKRKVTFTENQSRLTKSEYWSQATSSRSASMVIQVENWVEGSTWKESNTTTISSTSSFQKVMIIWFPVSLYFSILTSNQQCRCWTVCDPISLGLPTSTRTAVWRLLKPPYCVSKQTWPISTLIFLHGPKLATLIK
jgi:hypothetical protein